MLEGYSWSNKLPDESLEVYEPNVRLFFETMYERQLIWKRRFIDKKERPWTDNPILRDYKFTNVYRELDRNSQWQIHNIMRKDLNLLNLVWKIMVFRFFNNPETFSSEFAAKWESGIPNYNQYNVDEFAEVIEQVRKSGKNPYTNAYLINSAGAPGKTRDYFYTRIVIPTLHKNIPTIIGLARTSKTPEELIKFLKGMPSVAAFIAHEFYQDFTYVPKYTDKYVMEWTQNDFTNVGPGAMVGIRLVYPSLKGKEQVSGIYKLRDAAPEILGKIASEHGEPMPYIEWDKENNNYKVIEQCNITLHQIEMWLCEFQKYWKMTIGEGKQRSKFIPKTKV